MPRARAAARRYRRPDLDALLAGDGLRAAANLRQLGLALRRVDRLALVFLVNLIGAATGVGWVAAMIMAFGPRRPSPAPPPAVGNRSR